MISSTVMREVTLGEVADLQWGDTSTTKSSYVKKGYTAFSASGPDGNLPYADFNTTGVVISAIGADCGKTWLAKGQWSCIKNTMRFWSKDPQVDTEYLYWATRGVHFWPRRGSAQPFISQGDARIIRLLIPPLSEQKRIAGILGRLDDKIELNRKMNATLEQMVQTLFKCWFIDFDPVHAKDAGRQPIGMDKTTADLFPDSFEDSKHGKIPKGWRIGTLGEIATNPKRGMQPKDIKPGTPYIGLEHMPRRCITLSEWGNSNVVESGKSAFKKGEILFGKLRPYFHKVGIAPLEGVCSTDILILAPKSEHWYGCLLCHSSSKQLIQYTDRASTGTKMPRTNWGDICSFEIVLPPLNVAQNFTLKIQPMLSIIQSNIFESCTLINLRNTLLPKLLSRYSNSS